MLAATQRSLGTFFLLFTIACSTDSAACDLTNKDHPEVRKDYLLKVLELMHSPMFDHYWERTPCYDAEVKYYAGYDAAREQLAQDILNSGKTRDAAAAEGVRRAFEKARLGDLDKMIDELNAAWTLDPDNGDVYHGFAIYSLMTNKFADRVDGYFQSAFAKGNAQPTAYSDYGRHLLEADRIDESVQHLEETIERFPDLAPAMALLAAGYRLMGNLELSCVWVERAKANGHFVKKGYRSEFCPAQ
ncbi:MAG: hypothetical protein RIC16_11975 [Rhodospirillales bacterium]